MCSPYGSPTEGSAGILITVDLTCFNTINDQEQEQGDEFRLIINDKKLRSRVQHGSNGSVTLCALLSTSLASLSGPVPMTLYLHRGGLLFDYCHFGHSSRRVIVGLCGDFLKAKSGRGEPNFVSRIQEE